jgi:hypothetical protein
MSADVARLCIIIARQELARVSANTPSDEVRLFTATRYLHQALAALHPPAEPPSAMFWLGADAMCGQASVAQERRSTGRQSLPGTPDVGEDPPAPEPPPNAPRAVPGGWL